MSKKEFIQPTNVEEAIEVGKELIRKSTANLLKLDEKWRANINVMLPLINERYDAYQYASEAIREDKMLAYSVVAKLPKMLKFVAGGLNNDLELIKLALANTKNKVALFEFISDELKDNKAFVLSYISDYPMILQFVSSRLKDDDMIVRLATAKNPNALKFASMRFRDDKEFVLSLAYKKSTYKDDSGCERKDTTPLYVIQHASSRLRSDPEIVNEFVKLDIFTYRCFSKKVRSNKKFAMTILKKEGILLDSVSEELQNDKQVVLVAVKSYGSALEFASEELKNDRDVVLAAVKKNGRALMYASKELRNDVEIINIAFKTAGAPFIIDPLAQKVFERLDRRILCGVSEDFVVQTERNITVQMSNLMAKDIQTLEEYYSKMIEKIKAKNLPVEEEEKEIKALETEKNKKISKVKREYSERKTKQIDDIVFDKRVSVMEASSTYQKLKKFYDGTMTASEVLILQDWLLSQVTEVDRNAEDEFSSNWSDPLNVD